MWLPIDEEIIPTPFLCKEAEGKTFLWLYLNKPAFCVYIRNDISECTGFWKVLQTYLLNK